MQWSDVLRDFDRLLKGEANEWYWLMMETKEITDWNKLKEAMWSRFRTNRSKYVVLRDLEERKQRPWESLDSYFQLRARLRTPLPESEMIRIARRNMRQNISQVLYSMKIYTDEQLRDESKEVEWFFLKRESIQPNI